MQVVLVYLQYISVIIHSKCASQPKKAKKSPKTHIFGVQGRSRSSMLVPPGSLTAVLVMIRSKSVSICNHCRARLVNSSRNRTFSRGYPNLMRLYRGLIERRGSNLTPLKSTFNAKHFIRRLSWSIWTFAAQFTLKMCIAAWNRKKFTKPPYFGGTRSSMLVPLESSSAVLIMISSKSVSICNHSRARLVDSSRNCTFSRGCPNLMRGYRGLLEPRGSNLTRWNLRLMPNISYAACPGLSWMVSAQFILKMCIAA